VEVHLPCPPLDAWLPVLFGEARVGAWTGPSTPRSLRPILASWPTLGAGVSGPEEGAVGAPSADDLGRLEVLLFGVRLERPEPPEACLAGLEPGTLVVELAQPRRRLVRELLALERPPAARAERAQSRVLQWLGRGYAQLQQWESVEPHGVLVTVAVVR